VNVDVVELHSTLEEVAHHEAGHCVYDVMAGHPVTSVRFWRESHGWTGETKSAIGARAAALPRDEQSRDQIRSTIAGALAHLRFAAGEQLGRDLDLSSQPAAAALSEFFLSEPERWKEGQPVPPRWVEWRHESHTTRINAARCYSVSDHNGFRVVSGQYCMR
jgi:hypothetical protein